MRLGGEHVQRNMGGAERSTWEREFFITYMHEILRNKEKSKVNENIFAVDS